MRYERVSERTGHATLEVESGQALGEALGETGELRGASGRSGLLFGRLLNLSWSLERLRGFDTSEHQIGQTVRCKGNGTRRTVLPGRAGEGRTGARAPSRAATRRPGRPAGRRAPASAG